MWEVHPITKIEVMKDGQFVDLEQQEQKEERVHIVDFSGEF